LDVKLIGFEEEEIHDSVSVVEEKNAAAAYEIRYLRKQLMTMESELQSLKKQFLDQSESGDLSKRSRNLKKEEGVACVGCMHSVPLFKNRRNRKPFGRFVK